jgi:hypothetical protein
MIVFKSIYLSSLLTPGQYGRSFTASITSASDVTETMTSGNRSGIRSFQTLRRRVAS